MDLKEELRVIVPNAARKRNQTANGGSVEVVVLKAIEMFYWSAKYVPASFLYKGSSSERYHVSTYPSWEK